MYTLKGIFPEPKKEHKKNFIRENMRQVKLIHEKTSSNQPKFPVKSGNSQAFASPGRDASAPLGPVKSSTTNKSSKMSTNVVIKPNTHKKVNEVKIKKGDMAEFLKRKEQRHQKPHEDSDDEVKSTTSSGRLRDIACQTMDTPENNSNLTVLYPKKDEEMKASGDTAQQHNGPGGTPQRTMEATYVDSDKRNRSNKDLKDPYLPTGYQKGVVPKYLRGRREEEEVVCPAGHVTLPDHERRETLRMLRNSFAELVSELNKMPVKTDTLRMRNRKMELEKQLAKLEEGIKVFSRPKVFVKIGE